MKKKLIFLFSLLIYTSYCFSASLGFNTPAKIFLPGEIFTNNIVINYDSSDSIASGIFLNVQWESDTVEVRTAIWNETDFSFNEQVIFNTYSNQYSNIFLYSSCQPFETAWNSNTNLTVLKLVCAIVGRELCDFEFNDYTNALPFPTTANDEAGNDILGDPGVLYDGFDVLPIITRSAAGYIMSADLSADNVAIIRDKTNIVVSLLIKNFGKPLPYEHIRATLDYDETVTKCKSNAYEVLGWLENVQFTIEKTNFIRNSSLGVTTNLEPTGTLIFDAECPLTNFTGKLAEFHFKPIDYDESEFEFDDGETFVNRNEVNLLGLVDEDDDGLENSIVYVLSAGEMRYVLKMRDKIEEKHSESKATLFLTSEKEEYFDELNCSLHFNKNKIGFSDNENNAFKLNPDFTNETFAVFYTDSINYTNRLYDQSLHIDVYFDNIITNKKDELIEIGEIMWTNLEYGIADFFFNIGDSYIEFEGRDLINDEKQYTEFPASMQIIDSGESSSNALLIKLIPATLTNYIVQPGQKIELNVCGMSGQSVTGFGNVVWRYDQDIFRATSLPPNMWTNQIIIEGGSITSDIFGISGEFLTSGNGETNIFTKIAFQAVTGQKLYLEPLRNYSQITNVIGTDALGSEHSTNDGIFGITIVSKEPEEIFLRLKPTEDLFAGKYSKFVLELLNPLTSSWTSLRAQFEIDVDELLITNREWNIKVNQDFPSIIIETNVINISTNIYQKLISTPSNTFTRISTSVTTLAILQLSSASPIITKELEVLGSFYGMPLEDEIYYDFFIDSSTGFFDLTYVKSAEKNVLNENLLSEDAILSDIDWMVSPSGVKIWMKADNNSRPILQTRHTMYVYVDNPNNIQYKHVTLAWSYDADNFEILSAESLGNFEGKIWKYNHNDDDGYLCADLTLPDFTNNLEYQVLKFDVLPKLTDTLEMDLNEIDVTPTNTVIPGVWQGDYNLLETIDDDVYDNCQEWKRGTELTPAPLLYFWDIDDLEGGETILYLKDGGTGLEVYKEGVNYKWWVVGNTNIGFEFDFKSMIAKMIKKDNWIGQEIFWIYCQNLNNGFISKDSIKITVNNPDYEWNTFAIDIERDDYFTITDIDFTDMKFDIINPPDNYSLNASIITNGITTEVAIIENNGMRNIEWHSPNIKGRYYGSIVATNLNYTKQVISNNFYIQVLDSYSNIDPTDGDRFEVKINNEAQTLDDPTRIHITGGFDNDKIKVKVWKDKNNGDGIVNFDEIISDSGIQSISLNGSINLIQADGAIGSVKVKRGIVGQITAKKGGVNSVKISTAWDNYYQEFYEVGLLYGISAQEDIGVVKVTGGDIGEEDEPAIISSANGSIKTVITKMKKKVYWDGPNFWDDIWIETAGYEGANIYAKIYAPNGEIGSVIAVGGKIGSHLDFTTTEIISGNNIKTISAVAKKGDFEILGGFIHADILANGDINKIIAKSGDICSSTDTTDIDGSFDKVELIEYPVIIYANKINNISAKGKSYGFRDGPGIDDAYKEMHGGNISSYIVLQDTLGTINAKAGNMSVYLETQGNINSIKAKSVKFKEYWDDPKIIVGGNIFFSVILPNTKYRSAIASDYKNVINNLNISGIITGSWIGIKGPYNPKKFKYKSLINSEIWADGQKVNE